MPHLPPAELSARDATRPAERRVPAEVLARHAHRRSLLSAALLREEGFDEVVEACGPDAAARVAAALGGPSRRARETRSAGGLTGS